METLRKITAGWVLAGLTSLLATQDAQAAPIGIWINQPEVFVDNCAINLPGGIACLFSGYRNGTYRDSEGVVKTANVSMTSEVAQIGPKQFRYTWTIINTGTGDFFNYKDTGNGPDFLKAPPLSPNESETDVKVGGPPVIGQWGGSWNPEVGLDAERLEPSPIPLPATVLLMLGAFSALAGLKRRAA